tara:strand:- start:1381 stop:2403 length:1023 start_codon:yes stop_codon:yes gene_type:complete
MFDFLAAYEQARYNDIVAEWSKNQLSPVSDPLVARVVGASFYSLGDYSQARSILLEIESCFVGVASYYSLIGVVCRRCSETTQAKNFFLKALELAPDDRTIQNNYANLLIDLQDFDSAESILQSIVEEMPDYADAKTNLERLYLAKRHNEAGILVNEQTSASWQPADPLLLAFSDEEVRRTLATIKLSSKDSSASQLLDILPKENTDGVFQEQLKTAQESNLKREFSHALSICNSLLKTTGLNALLFECIADSYIGLKRFQDAEVLLTHALLMGSASFKIYFNLSTLALVRKHKALATYYLDKASVLEPDNSSINHMRTSISKVRYDFDCVKPWSTSYSI